MRKLIAVFMVLITVFGFVFAGGAKEAESVKEEKIDKLVFLYSATQTEVGPLADDWAGYAKIKEKFGVDVEFQMLPASPADQDIQVRTMAAGDQLPDFITCSREVYTDLVAQGMLLDVTDYYKYLPDRTKIQWDTDPTAKSYVTVGDRIYGFATRSTYAGNEGLLVREDWLKKVGLGVPKTLDDLYNVMYAFRNNDPDGNGKKDTYGFGAFVEETVTYEVYPGRRFEPLMGAFGVEATWNMTKNNFGLQIHKPEYYDWMVFFKKCIDNDLIDPNWQSYKKDDFRAAWKQGKFGVFREQNSAYASLNNYKPFDDNFPNGGFVVVDAPIGPKGKQSVGPRDIGRRIFAINSNCSPAKAKLICDIFNWMSFGEGYYLCGYGNEGKTYFIDPKTNLPSDEGLGEYGYNHSIGQTYIQLRNYSFNYLNQEETDLRYPAYITEKSKKRMAPGDVLLEMMGKTWTETPQITTMPKPSTDVQTLYSQGIAEFLNGKRVLNEANWKAFVAELDKVGATAWEAEGRAWAEKNNLLQ
ncbi:MAG: extracellular solute-binding protein [Sphaerochaetaceae bacterium]|nr:extracellular solute-binding protein [Sphaerochaetaceae bacterium]